ncbi:AraC family transcriptional regulator [Flexithrix dorotheae]|uniref:AraC family transcriptional regulator n=1 Tax=Flexithrix dorotheae TaxID=70993 RepID=UPI00036F3733|nr:AraC family transcriptional regulator [Flexithrix dorotheae]
MEKIPVRQIKEPNPSKSFNIIKLEDLLFENDMVQELHRHNFFFALFIEIGSGEHVIDFTPYSVSDHSVFFMRPGQVHQLTLKKGSKGFLIQFNRDFYSPKETPTNLLLRKVSYKNHCPLNSEKFKKLLSLLSYIYEEYTQKQDRYKEVIKANLEILFIEIVRQSQSPKTITNNENQYSQQRIEELFELLQNHILTHKQVAEYAEMMHLSSFQINKITKETVGKTCSQIINEQVLLEAKRNLLGTSNQVNNIAYNLGYEDTSYFIRFFKKHTGVSPETFRKNFK